MTKKVLISGASIAGPTAAFWLARHGIDVTIVEKANGLRGGGYPIDIRGSALEIVERMGLLPRLRQEHVDMRRMSFIDAEGVIVGPIDPELITGGVRGRDIEIPRGGLAAALYDATKDTVTYRFDDSIAAINQTQNGVDVRFDRGDRQSYDIVIAADGLHSNVRSMVFGPEHQFERYIGYCFGGFSVPNKAKLGHECHVYNVPGKLASLYAIKETAPLIGMLVFRYPESPFKHAIALSDQRALVANMFKDEGSIVPELLTALNTADDFYFDAVSQIRMSTWSSGRVVLTGDAAHATSFLSGQGSSVALVSGYVLAGEIATHSDYTEAFESYESVARGFIEANQDLVSDGRATMIPDTAEQIKQRNAAIVATQTTPDAEKELHGDQARPVYSAITLPDYD